MDQDNVFQLEEQENVNELSAVTGQVVSDAFGVICEGLQEVIGQLRQLRYQLEDRAVELVYDEERAREVRLAAARDAVRNWRASELDWKVVLADNREMRRWTHVRVTSHPYYKPAIRYWRGDDVALAQGDFDLDELNATVRDNGSQRQLDHEMANARTMLPVTVSDYDDFGYSTSLSRWDDNGGSFWDDIDPTVVDEQITAAHGW